MKIAVCDDEKIFRDEIIEVLYHFFGKLDLDCVAFEDGYNLVDAYKKGAFFDAIFLDIEMTQLDGMSTADELRKNGYEAPIVFLTSHTEMAMEGYEVAAFRFLAKPINREKMERTLYDLKEELQEKKRLLIRYEGEEVILPMDEICYVEAMNNSVSVVTLNKKYMIRKKISDMEKELLSVSDCFVRIHRGYIVNLLHVKKCHGNEVYMTGDVILPLSRGMIKEFKSQLFQYVRNSAR